MVFLIVSYFLLMFLNPSFIFLNKTGLFYIPWGQRQYPASLGDLTPLLLFPGLLLIGTGLLLCLWLGLWAYVLWALFVKTREFLVKCTNLQKVYTFIFFQVLSTQDPAKFKFPVLGFLGSSGHLNPSSRSMTGKRMVTRFQEIFFPAPGAKAKAEVSLSWFCCV